MKSITLRLTDLDIQTIENLKTATGEATQSKALLIAARDYLKLLKEYRHTHTALTEAQTQLRRIVDLSKEREVHANILKQNAEDFRKEIGSITV